MDDLYNRFRFEDKDIFRGRRESTVHFVFYQVSFFLEVFKDGYFSYRELSRSVDLAAKSTGIIIPDQEIIIQHVMDFFCHEMGFKCTPPDYYSEIREVVRTVILEELPGGYRFIEPLSRMICDEFSKCDYSTTIDEVTCRLKSHPSLRFLPYSLLMLTVNSVYSFFTEKIAEEE